MFNYRCLNSLINQNVAYIRFFELMKNEVVSIEENKRAYDTIVYHFGFILDYHKDTKDTMDDDAINWDDYFYLINIYEHDRICNI